MIYLIKLIKITNLKNNIIFPLDNVIKKAFTSMLINNNNIIIEKNISMINFAKT
jgi:hypothetical protein